MTAVSAKANKTVPVETPEKGTASAQAIRLVTAVQYPLIRAGIRELVAGDRAITIVGETDNTYDLPDQAREGCADAALVSNGLPQVAFGDIVHELRAARPSMRVLLMILR